MGRKPVKHVYIEVICNAGVRVCYTEKLPFVIIRLFKPICNERKGNFNIHKSDSLQDTKVQFTKNYTSNYQVQCFSLIMMSMC